MAPIDRTTRRKLVAAGALAQVVAALQAIGVVMVVSTQLALLFAQPSIESFATIGAILLSVWLPSMVAQVGGGLMVGACWRYSEVEPARVWRAVRLFWWAGTFAMLVGLLLVPPVGLLWLVPLLLAWQPATVTDAASR